MENFALQSWDSVCACLIMCGRVLYVFCIFLVYFLSFFKTNKKEILEKQQLLRLSFCHCQGFPVQHLQYLYIQA